MSSSKGVRKKVGILLRTLVRRDRDRGNTNNHNNSDDDDLYWDTRAQLPELITSLEQAARDKSRYATQLLDAVKRFPELGCMWFRVDEGGRCCTILNELIRSGLVDLPQIKEFERAVASVNASRDVDVPDPFLPYPYTESYLAPPGNNTPLHIACKYASGDVIQYLANRNPGLAAKWRCQSDYGEDGYPFYIATTNRVLRESPNRIETLKMLLDLCPALLLREHYFNPVLTAFLDDEYPIEFLEYMIDVYPVSDQKVTHAITSRNRPMTLAKTKILCKLMDKMAEWSKMNWTVEEWDQDACRYFTNAVRGFQEHTLTELTITWEDCRRHKHALQWMGIMEQEIMEQEFNNNHFLHQFYFTLVPGKVIGLGLGEFDTFMTLRTERYGRSIHSLKQSLRFINYGNVNHIMSDISSLPVFRNLTALELKMIRKRLVSPPDAITSAIVSILTNTANTANLEELWIADYEFHHLAPILEVLKTNSKLKRLKLHFEQPHHAPQKQALACTENVAACRRLLKHHNTTLTQLEPFAYRDRRILYYLDLNRLGRASVRTGTERQLVGLLVAAQEDFTLKFYRKDQQVHSILYGLLREAPFTWCYTKCPPKTGMNWKRCYNMLCCRQEKAES